MENKGRFILDDRIAAVSEISRLYKIEEMYSVKMNNIFKKLKLKPDFIAAEIGCGVGLTSIKLSRLVKRLDVYEISRLLIEEAQKNVKLNNSNNINFYKSDCHELSCESEKYDFVFSRFVIKHLFDPQKGIKEIVRIAKKNGIIMLIDKDIKSTIWFPSPPIFPSKFIEALNQYNAKLYRGGDANIGRKFSYYLKSNNLKNVKVDVVPCYLTGNDKKNINNRNMILEVYMNLIPELVKVNLIKLKEAEKDLENFRFFLENENSFGVSFDFIATGYKL